MDEKRFRELDSFIWFLCFNFHKENPDSYLCNGVFYEDNVLWNSVCSELFYDIEDIGIEVMTDLKQLSFLLIPD